MISGWQEWNVDYCWTQRYSHPLAPPCSRGLGSRNNMAEWEDGADRETPRRREDTKMGQHKPPNPPNIYTRIPKYPHLPSHVPHTSAPASTHLHPYVPSTSAGHPAHPPPSSSKKYGSSLYQQCERDKTNNRLTLLTSAETCASASHLQSAPASETATAYSALRP